MVYGGRIDKKDMNITSHIGSTLLAQTYAIPNWVLTMAYAVLFGSIIDQSKVDVGLIIVEEKLMIAHQEKTSLPFPVLIR